LLESGGNFDLKDSKGITPLMVAKDSKNTEIENAIINFKK
jgi:ankyrin repeat protein